jgi:DNA-binding NtrC family response regulator/tRNA A-37 threonylcarbamoyl transferase component Bud32
MDEAWVREVAQRYQLDDQLVEVLRAAVAGPSLGTLGGVTAQTVDSLLSEEESLSQDPDPGAHLGRYVNLGLLGRGGMGEVFRVRDPALHRTMAAKVLKSRLSRHAGQVARFLEEAQVTAQLLHPGVVPVHELGRLGDGRVYFTMQQVEGQTFTALIERLHAVSSSSGWAPLSSGWTFRRMVEAFRRACETVAYAHSRGVVHRDLKPGNIMLGEFGQVLVLDWGLAKVRGHRRAPQTERSSGGSALDTHAGRVFGTPAYMPPPASARGLGAGGSRGRRVRAGRHPVHPAERLHALQGHGRRRGLAPRPHPRAAALAGVDPSAPHARRVGPDLRARHGAGARGPTGRCPRAPGAGDQLAGRVAATRPRAGSRGAGQSSGHRPARASASAWQLVLARRGPVPVDVRMGQVDTGRGFPEPEDPDGEPINDSTQMGLMGRQTTHLLVLPLRISGGEPVGMVSLEAHWPPGTGLVGAWGELPRRLQAALDLATPAILALPREVAQPDARDPLLPVVGQRMAGVVRLLGIFSGQEETLLLAGATGTGKSRLARWCHSKSARADGPFEHVDLLTVPEDMQMPELFGWARGAFTGAHKDRLGSVGRAQGGTLFLDEIDKLSLKAQAGLLQLLETRQYRPLGESGASQRADLRFVIGTNRSLEDAVAQGRFREDLYYRINVLPVQVPSLDDRHDELGEWAQYMAQRRHEEARLPGMVHVTPAAVQALTAHAWPGNLRQLDNVVRRSCALALADGPAEPLVLGADHVRRALGFDRPATGPVLPELRRLAVALLDRVQDDPAARAALLDHGDALRGAILEEAARRSGGVRDAYLWLGRERTVASRNHNREYKRAQDALDALRVLLSEPS